MLLGAAGKVLITAGDFLRGGIDRIRRALDRENNLLQVVDRDIRIVFQTTEHTLVFSIDFGRQIALRQTLEHCPKVIKRPAIDVQQIIDAL